MVSFGPRRGKAAPDALVAAQTRDASAVAQRFAERHTAIMSSANGLQNRLQLLELLAFHTSLAEQLHDQTDDLIVLCRSREATWAQIALALGVSRQAAQQRYTARVERFRIEHGDREPPGPW